ncbi:HET-domain-containing protein [Ophiobolus disseminans]|uniref:HET-domain-containing protein n=1 Tax=Ophiobolus disseminans TaxID=1469910 RepID=A0A6A6ZGF6_9PLEO|nr:HET-domain-containing protein [Ophiobolus disseminans]
MRLINVRTLELSEFFGEDIPRYAILSHRWGRDEVGFEMFSTNPTKARKMRGFKKIQLCASQTKRDGLAWCWVDTCCIDKRSSSELSEAINSMFQWYEQAVYCYAYLEDVSPSSPDELPSVVIEQLQHVQVLGSEWFLRGWTLQELLAPKELRFYSKKWREMGSKHSLSHSISRRFGIAEPILVGKMPLDSVNIAQRMRWASARKTSRIEDIAYSLMGIFDVNMPLLYGEGRKAFIRLQEEIIKRSTDHSIFTWKDVHATQTAFRSLLARSPAEFENCKGVVSLSSSVPFAITNLGMSILLPLEPVDVFNPNEYLAVLNCASEQNGKYFAIRLRRTSPKSNQFTRVRTNTLYEIESKGMSKATELYVPEKLPFAFIHSNPVTGIIYTTNTVNCERGDTLIEGGWEAEQGTIRLDPSKIKDGECLMFRMLFNDKNDAKKRRLIIIMCNPHPYLITIKAGILGGVERIIYPNSYTTSIIIPYSYYTIDKLPFIVDADWRSMSLVNSAVTAAKRLVGDELMLIVDMQVNTFD